MAIVKTMSSMKIWIVARMETPMFSRRRNKLNVSCGVDDCSAVSEDEMIFD